MTALLFSRCVLSPCIKTGVSCLLLVDALNLWVLQFLALLVDTHVTQTHNLLKMITFKILIVGILTRRKHSFLQIRRALENLIAQGHEDKRTPHYSRHTGTPTSPQGAQIVLQPGHTCVNAIETTRTTLCQSQWGFYAARAHADTPAHTPRPRPSTRTHASSPKNFDQQTVAAETACGCESHRSA
jgi:hypothetical protein